MHKLTLNVVAFFTHKKKQNFVTFLDYSREYFWWARAFQIYEYE